MHKLPGEFRMIWMKLEKGFATTENGSKQSEQSCQRKFTTSKGVSERNTCKEYFNIKSALILLRNKFALNRIPLFDC